MKACSHLINTAATMSARRDHRTQTRSSTGFVSKLLDTLKAAPRRLVSPMRAGQRVARFNLCLLLVAAMGLNGCATRSGGSTPGSSVPRAPSVLPDGYVKSYVVFGKRYYVLGSAEGYEEKGTASWYGPNFNGRKTANGETYDMHGVTAAHKSLPLGTWVRVTNLSNQRTLDMRINDRGPFVNNRIIDLSMGAAKKLGVVGPGTAPVHVVALDGNPARSPGEQAAHTRRTPITPETTTAVIDRPTVIESRPAPVEPAIIAPPEPAIIAPPPVQPSPVAARASSPPAGSDSSSGQAGYIQVASFGEADNALRMATQLEQSGFNNVIIQALTVNNRRVHRVRLGPLISAVQQQGLLDKLASIGLRGARFVTQ